MVVFRPDLGSRSVIHNDNRDMMVSHPTIALSTLCDTLARQGCCCWSVVVFVVVVVVVVQMMMMMMGHYYYYYHRSLFPLFSFVSPNDTKKNLLTKNSNNNNNSV